jgi:capsid assembly protease
MKNLTYLASRIFNTPLLISPSKLDVILSVLGPRMNLDATPLAVVDMSVPKRYRADTENIDGIGIVPVYGTLVHRNFGLDALSGLTSYEMIRSWFGDAVNDSSVRSIILDIDSFGGEVGGCFALVDDIYEARSIKPIYAMINENAYSAGYAIASAATAVFIPPTGGAGSVGVVMVHIDQSAKDAKEGLKYNIIHSGERKKDFNPHEPLPKEVHASAQAMVDDLRDIFINIVARNRNLSAQVVRDTEAGVYHGQVAVDIGLADDVMSYSQLIENVTKSNRKGGKSMSWFDSKKASAAAQEKAAQVQAAQVQADQGEESPEQVYAQGYEDGMKAGNTAGMQAGIQAGSQAGIQKGIEQERARCIQVTEQVAAIAHLIPAAAASTLLNSVISSGAISEMAGQQIIGILAGQQANNAVVSTVSATSTGDVNSLVADARRRAASAQGRAN